MHTVWDGVVVVDGGGVVGLASVVGIVDFWCLFSSR